jgi:hypothetical protein
MLVQVDEPGRDNQACRMDDAPALQRRIRNARNASILNANITDSISLGFRIDDPSALDHDVVLLAEQEGSAEQ